MSKLVGKIISIGEVQVVSEKFQKLEFVIETEDQYPQKLQVQLTQDRVEIMKFYKVGSVVEVNVNIKGREWINPQGEAKYFISLDAWSISLKGAGEQKPKSIGNIEANFQEDAINQMNNELEDDGLPF